MGWLDSAGGVFSIRSVYGLAAGSSDEGRWPGWSLLWRFMIQQRVKVFGWILAHEKLLTNCSRWRRNMSESFACCRCFGPKEDVMHMVRDCTTSFEVWSHYIPQRLMNNFFSSPQKMAEGEFMLQRK